MTKREFIDRISRETGVSRANIRILFKALPKIIKDIVNEEGRVSIAGFIVFEKKRYSAKKCVNRTFDGVRREYTIPEKDVMTVSLARNYKRFD